MAGGALIAAGSALAIGAVAVLRYSWGMRERSAALNTIGWTMGLAALVTGWAGAGAWGATIVLLWAMGAACVALAWAGWHAPAGRARASNRRAGMMPEGSGPLHLGRRLTTFTLVAAVGFLSSVGFALGVRWLAALLGAGEADANVLALFATPTVWAVIAFLLLTTARRPRQLAILATSAAPALPAFFSGAL